MKKILIADHVQGNREILARVLEAKGLPFLEMLRGHDVINLDPTEVMLVLISQQLQDMTAFEVLRQVRKNAYLAKVPFIICSADNTPGFLRRCGEAKFSEVLLRPLNRRRVYQVVRDLLLARKLMASTELPDLDEVTITEQEKLAFLRHLLTQPHPVLTPVYNAAVNTAYAHPPVAEFFALQPGEGYEILREFTNDGLLTAELFNKVNLCPPCNWHTINLRETCPSCGSLDIAVEEVLHHFACGYVGPASDFALVGAGGMRCPKCEKSLRHIGLDYEKPTDTFVCHACQFIFTDPNVDFNCFYCGYVGKAEEVATVNIYAYRPTAKARKAVEQQSLHPGSAQELMRGAAGGLVNADYFRFILRQRHLALGEFGDELHLALVDLAPGGEAAIAAAARFLSGALRSLDAGTQLGETCLAVLISRRSGEEAETLCRDLQRHLDSIVTEDSPPAGGAIVYSFNPHRDRIDTFLTEVEGRFAAHRGNLAGKVIRA